MDDRMPAFARPESLRSLFRGRRPAVRPVDRHGRLRFTEGRLRRADGEAVTLRGMSLFWSQWMGQFFNADLVRWLVRDWQIDVIRIPVAAVSPGYLSDPAGETAKARAVIDAAIEQGIYAILDWHGHDPETGHAVRLFAEIAAAYGDCANLFYEPWNEPASEYRADAIQRHHAAVLEAVRAHAPNAPAILGSPDYCQRLDLAAQWPAAHDNIAYALHFYAGTHREGLRRRADDALAAGACLFASEWGLGDATGDGILDLAEGKRWLDFLNARQIGHLSWSLCDKAETCAALKPGASPQGGWRQGQLSPSGRFLRAYLRAQLRGRR
jgi:endoglucanase